MRATEHLPRDPHRILERCHGLVEIVERGTVVRVKRFRISPPHRERQLSILAENTSRNRYPFAQQYLGFFEAF